MDVAGKSKATDSVEALVAKSALAELERKCEVTPKQHQRIGIIGRALGYQKTLEVVRESYNLSKNYEKVKAEDLSEMFNEIREMWNAYYKDIVLKKKPAEYSDISKAIFSTIIDFPNIEEATSMIALLISITQERANVPEENQVRVERHQNCLKMLSRKDERQIKFL